MPVAARNWVKQATGEDVVSARALDGASSTAMHILRLSSGRRVVLRRFAWLGYVRDEPEAPGREVDALRFARERGLPVPEVVASDPVGGEVADGVPLTLLSLVPGRAVGDADPWALAEALAAIHRCPPAGFAHRYFSWVNESTFPPPASTKPALWDEAIERWRVGPPAYRQTFIHRDFHPGNVLWSRGRFSGVVDWVNGCVGPPACDLTTCKGNLVDLAGPEAAERFVSAYHSITGEDLDPYWELNGLLESDPGDLTPPSLAELEPRLAQVVALLR